MASSSSKGNAPSRTPARSTSSTGLFGTIRALTSSKSRGDTPDQSSLLSSTEDSHWPPSVDVELAFTRLDSRFPIEARIAAAAKLARIIPQMPAEGMAARIWAQGMDLLEASPRAGYDLLLACVKDKNLTLPELEIFCSSISRPLGDSISTFLRSRVQACSDIGEEGLRVMAGLESTYINLVLDLLGQSFISAAAERRHATSAETSSDSVECLRRMFKILVLFIESHSEAFSSKEAERAVTEVLRISKKTTAHEDMLESIRVLEALLFCSILPRRLLLDVIQLLAGIYFVVDALKPEAWTLMCNILRSSLGLSAVGDLFEILKQRKPKPGWEINVICGVVRFFRLMLVISTKAELPDIGVNNLLSALLPAVEAINDMQLEVDVMQLLEAFIDRNDKVELVFGVAEWTTYSSILLHCSHRDHTIYRDYPTDSWDPVDVPGEQNAVSTDIDNSQKNTPSEFLLQTIASKLVSFCQEHNLDRRHLVMSLLLSMPSKLDDETAGAVLSFYDAQGLLRPPTDGWLANCKMIFMSALSDGRRASDLRLRVVNTILGSYKVAETLNVEGSKEVITTIMESMLSEADLEVLEGLASAAVNIGTSAKKEDLFAFIVQTVILALKSIVLAENSQPPNRATNQVSETSADNVTFSSVDRTRSIVLAQALVRLFLQNVVDSNWKCQIIFDALLQIANSNDVPADSRITVLKLLARLRCNLDFAILVKPTTNCQQLAAALCRTEETVDNHKAHSENTSVRHIRHNDHMAKRSIQPVLGTDARISRNTSKGGNSTLTSGLKSRPTPPLWLYPGTRALPQEPPSQPSNSLWSIVVESDIDESEKDTTNRTLHIGRWLEFILEILQQDELEWEVYSYIVVHLGAQLSNHSLFVKAVPQIKLLRSIICNQLLNNSFHEPPHWTNLKKPDVSVCLYQILTVLITYHDHFAKAEEEEIAKVFAFGIGSSERSTEACIHGLSICSHEIPRAVSKWLVAGLDRMSRIITQTHLAVHVLEFLAGVPRSPDLFKDFREEEFRMVFQICFQYLDYVREQKAREMKKHAEKTTAQAQIRGSTGNEDSRTLPELTSHMQQVTQTSRSLAAELPQYVYALAYHVMMTWYMSLRLSERPSKLVWIAKNLSFLDERGQKQMEEQAQVFVDFMNRIAYSERDETMPDPLFATQVDGPIVKKSWLSGMSILTIETAGYTGASRITRRRPSGTKYLVLRPSLVEEPRHQVPINPVSVADKFGLPQISEIMPDDIVQSMYTASFTSPGVTSAMPMVVPEDEASQRTINAFDRISPLDGHKVGIIYIGPDQSREVEILANESGSDEYERFLAGIGTRVQLRDAKFNTQGLDRQFDTDGAFALCWRDRIFELVFHVTTMMPTNLINDPQCAGKKRHTGNDFVNIIFNESGLPYDFETFPSAFNFINILITPETDASPSTVYSHMLRREEKAGMAWQDIYYTQTSRIEETVDVFYNVAVLTKPGLPDISPASAPKTVSASALPTFVRLLALNASVFALAWANRDDGGEYIGSWRGRLREIQRLRTRLEKLTADAEASVSNPFGEP